MFNMNNNQYQTGNQGLFITKFLVQETGVHHDQFRRTFKTQYTGDVEQMVDQTLSKRQIYTSAVVAPVAGNFIKVSADTEKQIVMPGGFRQRRFRFLLELVKQEVTGSKVIEVISGYSDHFDLSYNNELPPDLVFNINSIMMIVEQTEHTPLGLRTSRRVVNNSHLLFDKQYHGLASPTRDDRLRPSEVCLAMSLNEYGHNVLGNSFDARIVTSDIPEKSSRYNGLASNYMAKIMSGYKTAYETQRLSDSAEKSIYEEAESNVQDAVASRDPFLLAMRQIKGESMISGTFTLRHLEVLHPQAVNDNTVTRFMLFDAASRAEANGTMDAKELHETTLITQAVTMLVQSVSAIAMELLFTAVRFQATNRIPSQQMGLAGTPHHCVVTNHIPFAENMEMTEYIRVFESRMVNEVLVGLSNNNLFDYDVTVELDMLLEAKITISLNGSPYYPYRIPTYCDAKYAPIVTGDPQRKVDIAKDFSSLTEQITEGAHSNTRSHTGFAVASTF